MSKRGWILIVLICAACSGYTQVISPKAKSVQNYLPENAVIAHRGTVFWAPELTEASFRWARNVGADYLELDVQKSKDNVLIIMHDKTFKRTTDVAMKFPGRENDVVSSFSLEEMMKLDAGSAFNASNPAQSRKGFKGLGVLVFEDVFRIAEGKKIKRNPDGTRVYLKNASGRYVFEYEKDPADNGNRPGIYIEFKNPDDYPGVEEQVYNELTLIGWNPLEGDKIDKKKPFYNSGKVNVGNTKGKILIQTFSRPGMQNLKRVFKEEVPTSFLVGNPKTNDFAKNEVMDEIIRFALDAGAQFIGTNLGETNDGLSAAFSKKIHKAGLKANAYSFNSTEQMERYFSPGKGRKAVPLLDGMITNRSELTIDFYHERKLRKNHTVRTPSQILDDLNYYL
jgi:glycerophosphoryl diester phosphodiesterase